MKLILLRLVAVTALAVCAEPLLTARAQDDTKTSAEPAAPAPEEHAKPEQPPPPKPKPQFFAGTLTTVDASHIIVSRTLVGKATETRTFLMQAKTKTNRALHPRQRVTVRYQHLPEGDVALEVLVRQPRTPKVPS